MGTEDWRLRRADELFGSGRLMPGEPPRASVITPAPRAPAANAVPQEDGVPLAGAEVAASAPAARVLPPVMAPAAADTRPAYRAPPVAPAPRRRAVLAGAVLAVAGLIAGALIGWFVRGPERVVVVAVPGLASHAVRVPPPPASATVEVARPVKPVAVVPEAGRPIVAAQVAPPLPSHPARTKVAVDTARLGTVRRKAPIRAASLAVPPARRARGAGAPSYDCRRNRGTVLRAICGDPALAALDRQLSARFAALDASADPATVQRIHRGETAFLNDRQSCPDRACLIDAYRSRLRELNDD